MRYTALYLLFPLMLALGAGCSFRSVDPTAQGLSYVEGGGQRQVGDLYLPEGSGPHPTAVVIHGGGWTGRDRSDMEGVAEQLAANGYAAFNINYRLAPEHRFPAPLEDVRSALRFLESSAEQWNLDTERFIAVGYSSGAHLALLAAELPAPDMPEIQAVVAGSAPVDLLQYPDSPVIKKLIGGTPEEYRETWAKASPIRHVDGTHPPVFLYHATWDKIVQYEDAERMRDALEEAGVPVELDTRQFIGHLLLGVWQGPSINDAIEFLDEIGLE